MGGRWRWVTGLAAVALCCLLAGFSVPAFKSREPAAAAPAPAPKMEIASVASKQPDRDVPVVTGPSAQAKLGRGANGARVKPLPPPVAVRKPVEAPAQAANAMPARSEPEPNRPPDLPPTKSFQSPGQAARAEPAPNGLHDLPPSSWFQTPAQHVAELEKQLLLVPEVDLDPDYLKKSKDQIAAKAKEIVGANKEDKDAFVRKLMKDRKDLAGMPFLLGKDCALPAERSKVLGATSLQVRASLSAALQYAARAKLPKQAPADSHAYAGDPTERYAADAFWREVPKQKWNRTEGVAALRQILPVENRNIRLGLVTYLQELNNATDVEATEALMNRAIFDLDPDVRVAALASLRERPKEQYRAALREALQYPWLPVVRHAAQAVATLDLKEMVPELVALLEKSDPSVPFTVKGDDGKEKMVVRELVRVNHHRNCMLCHAPVSDTLAKEDARTLRSLPVGPCPSPKEPLPPSSSTIYYAPREGITLVRADITYLRQDFSLRQTVKDHGKWSELQRFDFLVRTRDATAKEIADRPTPAAFSAYKEAIVDALIGLTGKNAAPTAQAWREALKDKRMP